ncbi:MAG TPA: hypothetical protein DCQ94_21595 [Nitrospira sp.]|nr:hypothetical protein [Nitrospira sp.]
MVNLFEGLYVAVDLIAGALHEPLYGILGLLLGLPREPVVEDAAFLIPENYRTVILDRDGDGYGRRYRSCWSMGN